MRDSGSLIIPPYFVRHTPSLTVGLLPHSRPFLFFSTIAESAVSSMR